MIEVPYGSTFDWIKSTVMSANQNDILRTLQIVSHEQHTVANVTSLCKAVVNGLRTRLDATAGVIEDLLTRATDSDAPSSATQTLRIRAGMSVDTGAGTLPWLEGLDAICVSDNKSVLHIRYFPELISGDGESFATFGEVSVELPLRRENIHADWSLNEEGQIACRLSRLPLMVLSNLTDPSMRTIAKKIHNPVPLVSPGPGATSSTLESGSSAIATTRFLQKIALERLLFKFGDQVVDAVGCIKQGERVSMKRLGTAPTTFAGTSTQDGRMIFTFADRLTGGIRSEVEVSFALRKSGEGDTEAWWSEPCREILTVAVEEDLADSVAQSTMPSITIALFE